MTCRGLSDLDAELEQLAMNLGGTPKRILQTHSSDQVAYLFADPRSATERTRLPLPVGGETHSMPTDDRVGPDNGYSVKDARVATIEPDEHGSVGPTQMRSTWHALLQDIELMPQHQDFGSQPPSRLETIAQHADEEEAGCNHATIMF